MAQKRRTKLDEFKKFKKSNRIRKNARKIARRNKFKERGLDG